MELKSIQIELLSTGATVKNIRTGEESTIVDLTIGAVALQTSKGVKVITEGTLKRWYKLVVDTSNEFKEVEPIKEEPKQEVKPEPKEELEPPIQTSKQAIRHAPNFQKQDPVLAQLRQKLIDTCLNELANCTTGETNSYTSLKVSKFNFAEIYRGKRRFNIRVMADALSEEQLEVCVIAPESYHWTLDATFTVLVEDDLEMALSILKSSYAYRLKNLPTRGFGVNK